MGGIMNKQIRAGVALVCIVTAQITLINAQDDTEVGTLTKAYNHICAFQQPAVMRAELKIVQILTLKALLQAYKNPSKLGKDSLAQKLLMLSPAFVYGMIKIITDLGINKATPLDPKLNKHMQLLQTYTPIVALAISYHRKKNPNQPPLLIEQFITQKTTNPLYEKVNRLAQLLNLVLPFMEPDIETPRMFSHSLFPKDFSVTSVLATLYGILVDTGCSMMCKRNLQGKIDPDVQQSIAQILSLGCTEILPPMIVNAWSKQTNEKK